MYTLRKRIFRLMRTVIFTIAVAACLILTCCNRSAAPPVRPKTIAEWKGFAAHSPTSQAFQVKGVVTFRDPLSDFIVIQDDSGGLRIALSKGYVVARAASLVEVSGRFSKLRSEASFVASGISTIHDEPLPPPVVLSTFARVTPRHLYRRVTLDGVVESVSRLRPGLVELIVRSEYFRLPVKAVLVGTSDVESLMDADVSATGVLLDCPDGSHLNYELWSPDIHSVEVLHLPKTSSPAAIAISQERIFRTARQIHQLAPKEAARHYPVDLHATVTFSDPHPNILFVQDKTDGMYVEVQPGREVPLRAGDSVHISGVTQPGEFAPSVARARIAVERRVPMPVPEPDVESAFMGQQDSRWLTLQGVVQEAVQTETDVIATLVWGKHTFKAHILAPLDRVKALIDREVTIQGACGSVFNNQRQVLGIQLFVPGIEFIRPKSAVVGDPFALPLRPANTLLQFVGVHEASHRARIRGVVTMASSSGPTWIRDRTQGLMVATHNTLDLRDGDVLDVVGFPAAGPYGPFLQSALIRKVSAGSSAAPLIVSAGEASKSGTESQLIQIEGILSESTVQDGERTFRLESGSDEFTATILESASIPHLLPGSKLRLTGICSAKIDDSQGTLLARGFHLTLRSPADVVVLHDASWLTLTRLGYILMGTLTLAIAALFWGASLRRNVRRQTRNLVVKSSQLEEALERAREAESLEQSRRYLLELIANDEPLDRIMNEIARAAEKHSKHAVCSLEVELRDGSRISILPSGITSISNQGFSVPILVGGNRMGTMTLESVNQSRLDDAEQALFPSWGQFASLAIEKRGLYESLSFRAQYDALTGLHNRASLYERLGQELASAKREQTLIAVLYLDLNGFKAINDQHGHDAGDFVLSEISKRLQDSVRRSDIIARIGGDEFVAVLSNLPTSAEAERIAGLLRSTLARPIRWGSKNLVCGGSLGVAVHPFDGDQIDTLLKKADQRMYTEKSARNLIPREESSPVCV